MPNTNTPMTEPLRPVTVPGLPKLHNRRPTLRRPIPATNVAHALAVCAMLMVLAASPIAAQKPPDNPGTASGDTGRCSVSSVRENLAGLMGTVQNWAEVVAVTRTAQWMAITCGGAYYEGDASTVIGPVDLEAGQYIVSYAVQTGQGYRSWLLDIESTGDVHISGSVLLNDSGGSWSGDALFSVDDDTSALFQVEASSAHWQFTITRVE